MATFTTIDFSGTAPNRRATVDLGGTAFDLRLRWNARGQRWVVDLFTTEGAALATGVALCIQKPVWTWLQSAGRPLAELTCVDTENAGTEIGFEDIGSRVVLVVIEA
jgi:hypothetical protein